MARIEHVLCPIDFSDCSRHAFDRAVAVARSHSARITALHVFPVPSAAMTGAIPFGPEGPGPFALHHLDQERLTRQLVEFVSIDPRVRVPVDVQVVEASSVFREILMRAERLAADLIVMGTHGRSGLDHWLLGSVTEKVLRRATVPVLTVPARAPHVSPRASVPFHRILCAVDFSESSHATLDYAASLADEADARLTVLHVVELLPVVYEPTIATPFDVERDRPLIEEAARTRLHRFVADLMRVGTIAEELVTSGKPYREILNQAAARSADLIVLGVHGHNAFDRFLFGSTANHVVRGATCPVMTVRSNDEHRARRLSATADAMASCAVAASQRQSE